MIVVDGRGEISSGVFGEMMLTYLKGKGGLGIVIDGAIRDFGDAKDLGLGMRLKGVTPYSHTQTVQFPYAITSLLTVRELSYYRATSSLPMTMVQ